MAERGCKRPALASSTPALLCLFVRSSATLHLGCALPQVLPAGPIHERCALTLLRQFHREHAEELAGALGWCWPAPV